MIKTSLTKKLIIVFSAILIAVVFTNIFINSLLLTKVHRHIKIDSIEDLYYSLYREYKNGSDSEKVISIMEESFSSDNLRVFIWDGEGNLVVNSSPFQKRGEEFSEKQSLKEKQSSQLTTDRNNQPAKFFDKDNDNRKKDFYFPGSEFRMFFMNINDEQKIYECDDYLIFYYEYYPNSKEKSLCLRGVLPGEYNVLLQMPYASVDEAIYVSNMIVLVVGICMLFLGVVIVTITSRNIAKPIKELSQIAKAMEKLDFTKKYTYNSTGEIASLGESINSLSEKLEITINQLYEKNEELLQDIELKSKIDVMRKEFIANASHELKTPLAIISGYAEGLKANIATDEESKELYADVIIEEANHMDKIIRQMLDLMDLDNSEKVFDERSVSLNEIVDDVVSSFDLVFKNKNINVFVDLDDGCAVHGDSLYLRQAIVNYISNAVNHVDENKIINIFMKKYSDKVIFSVYNSGANIPHDEKDNIWERFYKVDKAHSREYGGSGLGLSIVRSVIALHGGECHFVNHPEGIEFCFTLKNKENHNESK